MSRTPVHPGEILGDELEEIGISGAELSRQIRVPENRISQIIARSAASPPNRPAPWQVVRHHPGVLAQLAEKL